MAAPTKRTPETAKRIVGLLKKGLSRSRAYAGAGVGHTTFAEWLKEDEAFAQAVEEAESAYLAELETNARKLAKGDLRIHTEKVTSYFADGAVKSVREVETVKPPSEGMIQFLLEKRDPERYGRRLDVTSGGQPIQKAYVGFDPEEV